jgi:hypothetical protein
LQLMRRPLDGTSLPPSVELILDADSLAYQLVFALPRDAYSLRDLLGLLGIPLYAAGRALWRRVEANRVWDWLGQLLFPVFLQFAGLAMALMFLVAPGVAALGVWLQLSRGHYITVEGVVQDYTAGGPGDHPPESWTVVDQAGPHHYSYSPSGTLVGFHQTQYYGGPVRAGQHVRIADVDGVIARLEIAP